MNNKRIALAFAIVLLVGVILFKANIQGVIVLFVVLATLRIGLVGGIVGGLIFLGGLILSLQLRPWKGPSEMLYVTGVMYSVVGMIVGSLAQWGFSKLFRTIPEKGSNHKKLPNQAL